MDTGAPAGHPDEQARRSPAGNVLMLVLALALAVAAAGLASYFFFAGSPCTSSGRNTSLFAAPVLAGLAAAIVMGARGSRWWVYVVTWIVVTPLTAGLMLVLALFQWGRNCYT